MAGELTDEQRDELKHKIKEALGYNHFVSDEIIAIGKSKGISDEIDNLVSKSMIRIERISKHLRRIRTLVIKTA
ncbi:MAG: hypothetical protein R6V83_01525 [Candidatus Thorarchaeota archaeon]